MRCGPIEIVWHRQPARRVILEPASQPYLRNLGQLARMLHGLPWLLAGGLSIPLTLGTFYRRHSDADIVVPLSRLTEIDNAMRRAGYRLVRRFSATRQPHRLDFLFSVRASNPLLKLGLRRLTFRDPSRRLGPEALLSTICVYPYRETDEHFITCDGKRRFAKHAPIAGRSVRLPGGERVRCLNLHYVEQLKARRSGEIHQLDLAVIREGVSAALAPLTPGYVPASALRFDLRSPRREAVRT